VGVVAGRWPVCAACRDGSRNLPQPIRGYYLIRDLGKRGASFLALHEADGAAVVLKSIALNADTERTQVDLFMSQAESYRRLSHPYIAECREVGVCAGRLFFATQYVLGTTLDRLVL